MSLEKVFFGFFVLFAATLNFGFFLGDITNPDVHSNIELYAALAVGLVATVLKLGDRTQIGAVHLATSLVADIQLIAAVSVSGPIERLTRSPGRLHAPAVVAAAEKLSSVLRRTGRD